MKRSYFSLLNWVVPQLFIAVAVFFAADSAARYQENQDLRRQTEIWNTYIASPVLRTTEIAVSVRGGEVLLTGSVSTHHERALAEKLALATDGIERVDNRLEVAVRSNSGQRGKFIQHAFAFVAKSKGRGTMTGKTA